MYVFSYRKSEGIGFINYNYRYMCCKVGMPAWFPLSISKSAPEEDA